MDRPTVLSSSDHVPDEGTNHSGTESPDENGSVSSSRSYSDTASTCDDSLSLKSGDNCSVGEQHYECVINAWRQERSHSVLLEQEKQAANDQIKNLNMQAESLRHLLNCEKNRVLQAGVVIKQMIAKLNAHTEERDEIIKAKEAMVRKIARLERELGDVQENYARYSNALLATKEECSSLEYQLIEEREKLAKYRDERKRLVEKVTEQETIISQKDAAIKDIEKKAEDLEEKLYIQTALFEAACAEKRITEHSFGEMKSNHEHMTVRVNEVISERSALIEKIKVLEAKLEKSVAENKVLEESISVKEVAITELKTLIDETRRERDAHEWTMLDVAMHILNLPWTIYNYFFS